MQQFILLLTLQNIFVESIYVLISYLYSRRKHYLLFVHVFQNSDRLSDIEQELLIEHSRPYLQQYMKWTDTIHDKLSLSK